MSDTNTGTDQLTGATPQAVTHVSSHAYGVRQGLERSRSGGNGGRRRFPPLLGLVVLAVVAALSLALTGPAAAGDAAAGKKVFKKCVVCHTLKKGKNKVGPSLFGVIGRPAGIVAKYKYSSSIKAAAEKGLVWTPENLIAYVENPKKFLKAYLGEKRVKNKMKFKLKSLPKRQDVVAYLEQVAKTN